MDLYCHDKKFPKMSVVTKGLTPDCSHCADQVRRCAGFIGALEQTNTPFDQTNTTAVEEEELEVVAENGQDDADDDSGEEGGYQDWSTEAVEDEMPCCLLIGDEMPNIPFLVLAAELVCVRANLNKEQPDINQGKDAQFIFCPS